ncbi:MAG TPA: fatty acid CoA ligase family protein [Opitutaceae bacterium]|nr:fatty acid CoA ligase family protein [Opitutaceae bacterium]
MAEADVVNVSRHLWTQAAQQPAVPALRIPLGRAAGGAIRYAELNFAELAAEADAWAWRLTRAGVRRGDRVLVLVRPGLPLIAAVFALFKLGAPPIVIDPGMGRKNFLSCVLRTQPRVLLGIASAQVVSWIFRDSFRSVARRLWVSGNPAQRLARGPVPVFPAVATAADDLAAILFTSGSTGAPKGVCYEHEMFEAQVRLVRATYGIAPGEVDLAVLPVFALFNPALGMTTVVPQLDPSRPAAADPAHLVQAIRQNGVTNSFGSPVIWTKVARYCADRGITLPGVKRILMAGAPVPPPLFALMRQVFPGAQLHSPYGATEALPVSSVSAEEIIGKPETGERKPELPLSGAAPQMSRAHAGAAAETLRGRGTCVGRTVGEMAARVIALVDGPIATLSEARELPCGEIGEIIVRGPVVTKAYDLLPEPTARAKIYEGGAADSEDALPASPQSAFRIPPSAPAGAAVWHRMGDAGYLDADGRLWFCGRIAERVETPHGALYPDCVEPIFNVHPRVRRTALIGFGPRGKQVAALAVECWPERRPRGDHAKRALGRELRALGESFPHTALVRIFYFVDRFPVDVRHNAKIHRLQLARALAGQRGLEFDKR